MWVFNPSQSKTFRSPWFKEGVFPFGEGVQGVQNNPVHRRLDQFGAMVPTDITSVPGPMIRTQPITSPGLPAPEEPGTLYPSESKHESNSIFYNYGRAENRGYGSAPYWRAGQWSYIYPEYMKLTCTVNEIGLLKIGEVDDVAVTLPLNVSIFNVGTFLLKQSSGYIWTSPNPLQSYNIATNPNTAWSITYVPCYSVTSKSFPSRFCNWSLSFRPFYYGVPTDTDKAPIAPYSWVVSCCELGPLQTTNYIYIQPSPTIGGLRFSYGPTTSTIADWTGDVETYRALLESRFGAFGTAEVETAFADDTLILYKVHITASTYQLLLLHTNTLDSTVTIQEDVSGAYLVKSGTFHFFTPQSSFSSPDGTCKDTRDIGCFDRPYMTTLFPDEGPEFLPFGEQKTPLGLSHGSMSFKKSTAFRIHTSLPTIADSNPSFFNYPGWQFPAVAVNPNQLEVFRYPIHFRNPLFNLTVEPHYP